MSLTLANDMGGRHPLSANGAQWKEPDSPDMKRPRNCRVDGFYGGGKGVRTPGLRLAKPALSQLSYTPF